MTHDRDELVRRRFDAQLRRDALALVDDDLVEEHRRKPIGGHSDRLARVLHNVRACGDTGEYVLITLRPYEEFQLARRPAAKGQPPEPVAGATFTSLAEAEHAVFLRRLEELRAVT